MAEHTGEKTEQPTPRRMEEALKRGQIARSAELQTAFVLLGGGVALSFAGREVWGRMVSSAAGVLGHLHDTPLNPDTLPAQAVAACWILAQCTAPLVLGAVLAGLVAGAIQNRFNTAPEALTPDWSRLNPITGLGRIFSWRQWPVTGLAVAKLAVILGLTITELRAVASDPIFATSVSVGRLAGFLGETALRFLMRVALVLLALAVVDYAYQSWRRRRDLMMTREELKEELKHTEGNPLIKAARRRRRTLTRAQAHAWVPKADVVVTNPTHVAVALRYDRRTMRAPRVVAKGLRLQALQIREIARLHHVPIVENPPLARLLYRHTPLGGEIPASLYAAVAEVLAWVYRINRYRYYLEEQEAGAVGSSGSVSN
ncbi:MAG: EscU/YscU/HrcU family type III secretion system export apparatus switch protein [Verrucomicrobiota bacterium]|nr:EscU/YscU/HrcU family type III secretion system export apparatus switch protein [Limisphaera sp.]MDW8381029.1 EscU/YscU/HrcU family type III secretion system export apparatus switch protein [Verrucomicrobiota bacterium]